MTRGKIPLNLPLRKGEVLSFDRLRMSGKEWLRMRDDEGLAMTKHQEVN